MIRVLIADDSSIMRLITADVLKTAGGFEIVDYAANGKEAAEKCCRVKPDVVIMDMLMGEYDGIMGVKEIMSTCPTPIIILSAMENTALSPVMEALKEGAVDYHQKPNRSQTNITDIDATFIDKVRAATQARLEVLTKKKVLREISNAHTFSSKLNYDVIVIGSSTGGPSAVEAVLTRLPANLAVPVLIAQHMPSNFVPSFAARLNGVTALSVEMAKKDDVLEPGKVLIAPGSRNMIVRRDAKGNVVCDFTPQRFRDFNFPSVTGLMLSVAEVYKSRAIGVILTGMGKDGSEGMKAIKDAGGYTVAQSKETSVVFGMPGAAVELGAINKVVNIDQIGPFVVSCLE